MSDEPEASGRDSSVWSDVSPEFGSIPCNLRRSLSFSLSLRSPSIVRPLKSAGPRDNVTFSGRHLHTHT